MGADWVKNEFHSFVDSMTSKVDAARVAAPPTNEMVGVENEGAKEEVEEEVRHKAVAEKEEVRKEADSKVAEPEFIFHPICSHGLLYSIESGLVFLIGRNLNG